MNEESSEAKKRTDRHYVLSLPSLESVVYV